MEHILEAERRGAEREKIGSDVISLREDLLTLDKRRQANREALAWLKKRGGGESGESVSESEWYKVGDLFLCLPSAAARQTLLDERAYLEEEIERKSARLKELLRLLADVDGLPDPVKDFELRPINTNRNKGV